MYSLSSLEVAAGDESIDGMQITAKEHKASVARSKVGDDWPKIHDTVAAGHSPEVIKMSLLSRGACLLQDVGGRETETMTI